MSKHIFIPIKEHSSRVPRKNFREFCGMPLYLHTLNKYEGIDVSIYVDTDSDEIENTVKEKHDNGFLRNVIVVRRNPDLYGDDVSVNSLISEYIRSHVGYDRESWIAQIHVTTPFLSADTVMSSFEKINNNCDSIVSANIIQTRLWRDDKYGYCPVNHNPMKLEKTQDLPVFYEENSCFYIFNAFNFIEFGGYRVGKKPLFVEVNFPENLDIDTESDMDRCLSLSVIYN